MKISTRAITLAATLAALCAVTGFIPYVFFLPVMVAATTLSIGMVAFVGLSFGCISLAYSYLMPTSPVALAFIEAPYIPIVARVLAAVATFGVFKLSEKLFNPTGRGGRIATRSLSAAIGSLLNTAFVVGLMLLVMPDANLGGITLLAYVPTMLISGAIECPCMAVLTPPITMTLERTVLRNSRRFGKPTKVYADMSQAEHAQELATTEVFLQSEDSRQAQEQTTDAKQ
ncbi:MAG: hypothetical protein K2M48_06795 [Clostridiales bacterium]|nr:hypothetical protein [Clostridiales bacterium]